jgi:hypothetical protein
VAVMRVCGVVAVAGDVADHPEAGEFAAGVAGGRCGDAEVVAVWAWVGSLFPGAEAWAVSAGRWAT